jgi:hypothetical protein
MITYARCASEIKSRIVMAKATFNRENVFTGKLDLNLRKKVLKCYSRSIAWCWNLDTSESISEIYGNFFKWCWRRMENVSWTDRVRNEVVLYRVKEERNITHTIKKDG